MARLAFLAALSLANLALGQTIEDGAVATEQNVAPAVETVDIDAASSGIGYFPYESSQLTGDVIANLTNYNLSDIELFDFGGAEEEAPAQKRAARVCKTYPGDRNWPSPPAWTLLRILLGGSLIEGVPAAAPCYSNWPQYNQAKCAEITSKWQTPQFQLAEPLGIQYYVFEGVSCLPPSLTRTGAKCTLGGLPSYVVRATNVAQIQLAVNFARNSNLRLIVKNKGHDFKAKSTGAGALSIWTNGLQGIQYLGATYTHKASCYRGPAFKIGAGVQASALYSAADRLGLHIVGGNTRTVGIGGGYIAGGGHSPLQSLYGMAADQVLSMEVVLPNGRFVSVDAKHYPDLFFALRGGGGSTWGIVTSLVIRAYPKTQVTTLTYSFAASAEVPKETFWKGVDAVFAKFPQYADKGMYSYWSINCIFDCSFSMAPQWGNDLNVNALKTLSAPLFSELSALGINVTDATYKNYDGVLKGIEGTWPAESEQGGVWNFNTGSRLFPRSNWEDPAKLAAQTAALRQGVEKAGLMLGYNFKAAVNPSINQTNAVNPAWRDTLLHALLGATWSQEATPQEIATANKNLVETMQPWREASPNSGAYLNEADINEPNWQQAFYGSHYAYLYQLKQKYDPWGLLWAPTAVGSEDWYVTGQIDYYPTQNGKLCPK
ncbi:FAD-binding domain-containing protein [Durotheca rogersii]|uniref:FAD-binding domain-containing protein n=1 Tax=Durotheca rogersii TaxID=419775 RepID=UPI00221E8152|nr:FAD-binding domain-containing protein [Durotheca rogersii]KAI5864003.1 FAD-binding domain-containing protein [Durotheca rogersii]